MSLYDTLWTISAQPLEGSGIDTQTQPENQTLRKVLTKPIRVFVAKKSSGVEKAAIAIFLVDVWHLSTAVMQLCFRVFLH